MLKFIIIVACISITAPLKSQTFTELLMDNRESKVEAFCQLMNENPSEVEVKIWYAYYLFNQGEYENFDSVYVKLIKESTIISTSYFHFLDGLNQLLNNDFNSAKIAFQKSIDDDKNNIWSRYELGKLYIGYDDNVAYNYFHNAISIDSNFYWGIIQTCFLDFRVDPDNTIKTLINIPEQFQTPESRRFLGDLYYNKGDYSKSYLNYQVSIQLDSSYAYSYYGLANLKLRIDKSYKDAISLFEKCIEIDPNYSKAYIGLGWSNFSIENYSKAASWFSQALNIEKDQENFNDIILFYLYLEEYQVASSFIDQLKYMTGETVYSDGYTFILNYLSKPNYNSIEFKEKLDIILAKYSIPEQEWLLNLINLFE